MLRTLFVYADKDKKGNITHAQFVTLLNSLNPFDKSRAKRALQELQMIPDKAMEYNGAFPLSLSLFPRLGLYFLPFYSIRCCLCCLYIPPDYQYLTSLSPSPYVPLPGVNLTPISLLYPLWNMTCRIRTFTRRIPKYYAPSLPFTARDEDKDTG